MNCVRGAERRTCRPEDGSKSEKDWRATLRDYAVPKLGGRPVDRINTADVMAVLLPIWNEKRVTARRVRQRIGAVMRWAVAQGYREDNPAGEAIGAALPKNGVRPRHLAALPYAEVAGAIEAVRGYGDEFRVLLEARGCAPVEALCSRDTGTCTVR